MHIRKIVTVNDETLLEADNEPLHPWKRSAVSAVIRNPWINGGPLADLSLEVREAAPQLAKLLTERLIDALGGVGNIEAFGKAAMIGTSGELEHGAALIHTPYFGNLMREFLQGDSIICFADDRNAAGETLVVPMWHKTQAATRSHYQTVPVRISDAPRADEIVIIAAASTGPRPHARIGDRKTDASVRSEDLESVLI